MNPFDFFDKIYLINLSGETERLESTLIQLELAGIKDKTDIRIVENHNYDGLTEEETLKSVTYYIFEEKYKLIKEAKENGYSNILLLEDDLEFSIDIIDRLPQLTNGLPSDWDLFYLTSQPIKTLYSLVENDVTLNSNFDISKGIPSDFDYIHKNDYFSKVSLGLFKVNTTCFMLLQAFAINYKYYDTIINYFETIEFENIHNMYSLSNIDIDMWLCKEQVNGNVKSYGAIPVLATHKPFISTRIGKLTNVDLSEIVLYNELLKK